MTVYTSQMISGMIGQQIGMFQGYGGYAAGFGPGAGMGPSPFAAPPPPTSFMNTRPGQWGMYGEQMAMRMANFGRTAGSVGGVGMGVLGNMAGIPMDPFSGALMGAMGGGGFAGAMGGMAMGSGIGLGIYGAGRIASAYTNAFTGGMNDQAVTNSTLRNNFNFYGGGGAFGRGFGQNQMGQIGSMLSSEVGRSRGMTNMGELNSLVSGGADAGMFTGTRDVQSFTQNFRRMLDTLRSVQRELGGTLTEALQFVRSSQQAGIFQNADRVNFAAEIRTAEAVTGMDRTQLTALAAAGSNISRQYGGMGRQGAMGAVRMAQTLGSAVQSGAINQEMLSEATGGLTGADALSAFTQNMMSRSGAFSRRAMGRYSIFAMSNANGTGLDQDMMDRFTSGDLSVSEVSRAAHRRVGGMGRARALNREGQLRGAVMEEGGLAGQIGMMRLMVGDRVMDAGDDLGQLVLQRRFGMSRAESGVMMSLMRNQGQIAEQENVGRIASSRETAIQNDIAQNRGFEAFTRNLEHGLADATGLTRAREMGARFMTRISDAIERAGNNFLGIAADRLTSGDRSAIARLATGRGSVEDARRGAMLSLGGGGGGGGGATGGYVESLGRRSLGEGILHGLGLHTRATSAEILANEGLDLGPRRLRREDGSVYGVTAGLSEAQAREEVARSARAREGLINEGDPARASLERMMADREGTVRRISEARFMASQSGDPNSFLRRMGESREDRLATLAFMRNERMAMPEGIDTEMAGRTGGGSSLFSDIMTGVRGGEEGYTNALDWVAGGGRRGAELRRRRERGGGARVSSMEARLGLGALASEPRLTDEESTELGAIEGVNREALESVVGSEDFANRVAEMAGLEGNREALRERITAGMEHTERITDEGERNASRALYRQMLANVEESGGIGNEMFNLVAGPDARERTEQWRSELRRVGSTYSGMAGALEGVEGAEGLRAALGAAGGAFGEAGIGAGTAGDANRASRMAIEALAGIDRSTPEGEERYREMTRRMRGSATDESSRGIVQGDIMESERRRHLTRALSGRGRRGRDEALETVLSEATGGTFGTMEFTVRGERGRERTLTGTRAMRELLRGGEGAESILQQLSTNLSEASGGRMTEESSGRIRSTIESAMEDLRHGRGVSEETLGAIIGANGESGLREVAGMDAVRAGATERSMEAARAANPLDAQRNELLQGIQDRLADASTRRREFTELGNQIIRGVEVAIPAPEGEAVPPGAAT